MTEQFKLLDTAMTFEFHFVNLGELIYRGVYLILKNEEVSG